MNLLQMFLSGNQPIGYANYVQYRIPGKKFPDWSILSSGHFFINILPGGKVQTFSLTHPIGAWDMNESNIEERPASWGFNVNDPDAYEIFMALIAEAAKETEEDVREYKAREAAKPRKWLDWLRQLQR